MKNIHVLPTDKPSRIRIGNNGNFVFGLMQNSITSKNDSYTNQHIYITSDEEIKEGDWYYYFGHIVKYDSDENTLTPNCKKIILTTDQDLNGVQSIDDEFLEWFVNNPSCEEVEVENEKVHVGWEPDYSYEDLGIDGSKNVYHDFYKIIIPQEEPKQEFPQLGTKEFNDLASTYFGGKPKQETTLEEAAERWFGKDEFYPDPKQGFIAGAKWQQEQDKNKYSELSIYLQELADKDRLKSLTSNQIRTAIEQFKKK